MRLYAARFLVLGLAAVPAQLTCAAYARNKLEWPECVDENLSVEQCSALIKRDIEEGHVLDNINVDAYLPEFEMVTRDVVDDAVLPEATHAGTDLYYRVAVPTNYMGQAHGFLIDGEMKYTDQWVGIGSGPRSVGPWNCTGMSATQCCDLIQRSVPDRDINKNYIDCWVQQQEPTPVYKQNRIAYCAWEWDPAESTYIPRFVDELRQENVLKHANNRLQSFLYPEIIYLLESGKDVPYNSLQIIVNNLHFHGRRSSVLQGIATEFDAYLHPPFTPETLFILDEKLSDLLSRTKLNIENFVAEPFKIVHKILVQAGDLKGSYVKRVPRIGGAPGVPECVPPDQ